jgi:hypothetical protein
LYVAVLALLTLLMINVVSTLASTPTPSVPEFTIETISFPYDVPPSTTTAIDPYTGEETVVTQPGYHVENETAQLRITNQDFTPYTIEENGVNWTINLFYNIRLKGSFSQNWGYYWRHNGSSDGNVAQNHDSEYTIVSIDDYLPSEGSVDFQLEALIGYEQGIVPVPGVPGTHRVITGETSGWSDTQTITIKPVETPTPSPAATPPPETSPTPIPEPQHTVHIESIIGVAIVALIVGAALGLLIGRVTKK